MKITYEQSTDAMYIYLAEKIGEGEVTRTLSAHEAAPVGEVLLDFNRSGHLVGIEIIGASHICPQLIEQSTNDF